LAFISNDPKKNQQVINSQVLAPGSNAASEQAQDAMLAQQDKASPIPSQAPQVTQARQPSTPRSASSGTFTNVQQYIDKNKTAAQRMGESVQQNVQSAADIARKNIEQTQGKFSTEVERGSLQDRDTAVEEAKKVALAAAGGVQQAPLEGKEALEFQQKAREDFLRENLADKYDTFQSKYDKLNNQQFNDTITTNAVRDGIRTRYIHTRVTAEEQRQKALNELYKQYGIDTFALDNVGRQANAPVNYNSQISGIQSQLDEYNKSLNEHRLGQKDFEKFTDYSKKVGDIFKIQKTVGNGILHDKSSLSKKQSAMANLIGVHPNTFNQIVHYSAYSPHYKDMVKKYGIDPLRVPGHRNPGNMQQENKLLLFYTDLVANHAGKKIDPILRDALETNLNAPLRPQQSANKTSGSALNRITNAVANQGREERFIADPLTNPKYFDRTAEIKDLEKKTKMAGEDISMYQELAKVVPPQQLIPEILQKASEFDGEVTEERFRDIINAVYQGPYRLSQIKGYDDTVGKVSEADRRLALINKAGVSGDLLRTTFQSPGRAYTRGQEQLDSLLMGQGDTLRNLLNAKQEIGNVGDTLSQAQQAAMSEAATRQDEIEDIRTGARSKVQGISDARAEQIEGRLSQVIQDWDKLPQYFRDALTRNVANNQGYDVSALESQLLGVQGGEGLYNAIKDLGIENVIKATQADRNKLISQREFGNLQNLQRLAEMADDYGVPGSDLTFRSGYQDENLAGTQTAMDALDTQHLRDTLNDREYRFGQAVNKKIEGTGVGHDRYKSGGRSRDVWERVNLDTNLKNALAKAGYKFDRPQNENFANPEAVTDLAQYIQGISDPSWDKKTPMKLDLTDPQSYLSSNVGMFTGDFLTGIPIGSSIGQFGTNLINSVLDKIPGGGGIIGGLFNSGKGNAYNTARTNAFNAAKADLARNIQKELEKQGFGNRFRIDDSNQAVRDRRAALLKILGQTDLTNIAPQAGANDQIFAESKPVDPIQYIRNLNSNLR
jgi:hypothetical protein